MGQDVRFYVKACFICLRKSPPRVRSRRGALTRPHLFDLISMDYVGPRTINGLDYHFLVIIDHASRFLVADATTTKGAAHAEVTLKNN